MVSEETFYVSQLVKKSVPKVGRIKVFDTTLRDGEQTPGVSLTPEEKLEIATQLDKLGVDIIEAGFPITSDGEKKAVKLIAKAGLKSEICGLARVTQTDLDAAINCDVPYVHTFVGTSEIHMKVKLKMMPEQILEKAVWAVDYVKNHGLICEFSPEDATRTDMAFLKKICKAVQEAKVDKINIPDTVGVMVPTVMKNFISELKKVIKVPISVHCHNDLGLAVANSIAAVEGGATQVHATINGLGERAGNAALEEVVMGLIAFYDAQTNINTKLIAETSELVARLTGIRPQPNKAIVGENAFAHEAGIHVHGVLTSPATYEPITPEMVGHKRRLVLGKHVGSHGVKAALDELNIQTTPEQLQEIVTRIKAIGDKGKTVTDADLRAIAEAIVGELTKEEKIVTLDELAVVTGNRVIPTASVKLVVEGKERIASATGVGPVDAALNAIQKVLELQDIRLREYRLEAITGGSDAIAEVMIKIEDKFRNIVSAKAAREDIVMASVEAMVNAINRILLKRRAIAG
ncbi:MAG: 2-isopropylmalate synthase [Euryarchaeota archaeon]|nr:2-isopropylmalate synthase [Euryarchaeota archaeon]